MARELIFPREVKMVFKGEVYYKIKFFLSRKTFVCATPRSGSTYLCAKLIQLNDFGYPNEYFIKDVNSFSKLKKGFKHKSWGVKIMFKDIHKAQRLLSPGKDLGERFKKSKWIYLERNDVLYQAISQYLNQKTQKPHKVEEVNDATRKFFPKAKVFEDEYYNGYVPFSYCAIKENKNKIEAHQKEWDDFFKKNKIVPLVINYEELVNRDGYLENKLLEKGWIKRFRKGEGEEVNLKKVGNSVNDIFYDLYSICDDEVEIEDGVIRRLCEKYTAYKKFLFFQLGVLEASRGNSLSAISLFHKSREVQGSLECDRWISQLERKVDENSSS